MDPMYNAQGAAEWAAGGRLSSLLGMAFVMPSSSSLGGGGEDGKKEDGGGAAKQERAAGGIEPGYAAELWEQSALLLGERQDKASANTKASKGRK